MKNIPMGETPKVIDFERYGEEIDKLIRHTSRLNLCIKDLGEEVFLSYKKAIKDYDASKNALFSTFFYRRVRGLVSNHYRKPKRVIEETPLETWNGFHREDHLTKHYVEWILKFVDKKERIFILRVVDSLDYRGVLRTDKNLKSLSRSRKTSVNAVRQKYKVIADRIRRRVERDEIMSKSSN